MIPLSAGFSVPEKNTQSWERGKGVYFAALTLKQGQEGEPGLSCDPSTEFPAFCRILGSGPLHVPAMGWGHPGLRLPGCAIRETEAQHEKGTSRALGAILKFSEMCCGFGNLSRGIEPTLQPIPVQCGGVH